MLKIFTLDLLLKNRRRIYLTEHGRKARNLEKPTWIVNPSLVS